MDWLRKVERGIFGEEWKSLSTPQKKMVERVLLWCVDNPQELPCKPVFKTFWGDYLTKVIDDSLKEIYERGMAYFMERGRERWRVEVRYQIFAIFRDKSKRSSYAMSQCFGYNHSTIAHSLEMHEYLCKYDKEYEGKYKLLLKTIDKKCEKLFTSFGRSY